MTDKKTVRSETQPTFRPFNPEGPVRVYVRHLPHWRQPGATYFVTFRQDDSIPAAVLLEWTDIKRRWYRAHDLDPEWLKTDPDQFAAAYREIQEAVRRAFEREQARLPHEELDRCHGSCVLRHRQPQRIIAESLPFFHGQRFWLGDSVIMPNHAHLIVQPFDGWELEDLLGSIKKWTSRLIGSWLTTQPEAMRPQGPVHNRPRFWQPESYDRIIRDEEELTKFRTYIAQNPNAAHCRPGEFVHEVRAW
jgi:REP element-mobilizing transposase RayT